MKKQQVIVITSGCLVLIILYFFGNTIPPKTVTAAPAAASEPKNLEIAQILQALKAKLRPGQLARITMLENSVVRGDVKNQQIKTYNQLAGFWRDSVENGFLPAAYYTAESAKLENSEKSLTFAAQLFLENLRAQDNQAIRSWMATRAKELFQMALVINPDNDSLKVGLGGSYIFGSSAGNPQEVMQGIQTILAVARKDSSNMYAQMMLGLGGIESGQFDKAIERLQKVVAHQPRNLEAILILADTYERTGDKADAIKMYEVSRKLITNPDMVKEVDQRIKTLQQ